VIRAFLAVEIPSQERRRCPAPEWQYGLIQACTTTAWNPHAKEKSA